MQKHNFVITNVKNEVKSWFFKYFFVVLSRFEFYFLSWQIQKKLIFRVTLIDVKKIFSPL